MSTDTPETRAPDGKGGSADAGAGREAPRKGSPFGFVHRIRNWFLAGVLVTAPIGITIYVAWAFIKFVDNRVTPLIPARYNPETYLPFGIPGLGLIVLMVGLVVIGALTAGLAGRLVIRAYERVLERMPVVRSIYGAIKQITETVLAAKSTAFRQVVIFEYPRRGVWSMGFITGRTEAEVQNLTEDEVVNVFLPTTPNPTSGYLLFVPRKDLVVLSMTVEEGIKMVVSGGIVTPPDRRLARQKKVPVIRAAEGDTPTIGAETPLPGGKRTG